MGTTDELIRFDIRLQRLRSVVPALGPGDIVYLLAAHSSPSWIFDNQAESRQLNLIATKRVIDEVIDAGVQLIFIAAVVFFLCLK